MTAPVLLLTRPEAAARRFALQLGLSVETLLAPLIRIDQLDVAAIPADLHGIILTSENGAIAAARIRNLPTRAYCVGDHTAEAAREEGFDPISAKGDAEALIALILSQTNPGSLLHIRGEHARGNIVGRLNAAGVVAMELVTYRQQDLPLSPPAMAVLQGQRPVILPLFSPRTVTMLAQLGPFSAPLHAICISAAVAKQANALSPLSMTITANPDAGAMANATRNYIDLLTIN